MNTSNSRDRDDTDTTYVEKDSDVTMNDMAHTLFCDFLSDEAPTADNGPTMAAVSMTTRTRTTTTTATTASLEHHTIPSTTIQECDKAISQHNFYYAPSTSTQEDHHRPRISDLQMPRHATCMKEACHGFTDEPSFSFSYDQQHQFYESNTQDRDRSSYFPMVTPPNRKFVAGTNGEVSMMESNTTSTNESQNIDTHLKNNNNNNIEQTLQHQSSSNYRVSGVPHVYHDYISQSSLDDEETTVATYIRKKTGGVSQPFPEKLHEMLTAVDNTEQMDIVHWLPHGRAFIVRKPKEFTDHIMPK
jgi:HSF-type DNA-binding